MELQLLPQNPLYKGVSLRSSLAFFTIFIRSLLMSQEIPNTVSTPVSDDEISPEERLRIRKNCMRIIRPLLHLATSANIPPQSPEHVPPRINNSDEQCKPLQLPRPISL